jgi:hypothetical protein
VILSAGLSASPVYLGRSSHSRPRSRGQEVSIDKILRLTLRVDADQTNLKGGGCSTQLGEYVALKRGQKDADF